MARRRPTPREPQPIPSHGATALFVLIVLAAAAATYVIGSRIDVTTEAEQRPPTTHDSLAVNYTYDGEIIRWYEFTDPDTGIKYLVNDRGGCTPRLDMYGEPMGGNYHE